MQTTIDDIIRIADDLHLESASQDLAYLKRRAESADKEIIIPLVGEFSSGKTSLINSLMDGQVLETASKPVTSTIYEIKFGADSAHAEVIWADGRVTEEETGDLRNDRLEGAKCVMVFDTSTKIGRQTILVDTPGLSSNNPQHKITIASFLPHSDAILIVTDVNQQVTRSLIDFVKSAQLTDRPIYLAITKCDTKSTAEIESVKAYIKENLNLPIENMACVSAAKGNLGELLDMFGKIQAQKNEIVGKAIAKRVEGIAADLSNYIDELVAKSSDSKDFNAKIVELQDELERTSRNIDKLIRDASTAISDKGGEYANKFQEQACSRLDAIVQGKSGDYDFEVKAAVNTIAQATIQQYKRDIQYILTNMARERQRTVGEVPLQSLESLDLSGVVINGLSYNLDLAAMGHQHDKLIGNVTKAAAVVATICAVSAMAPAAAGPAAAAASGKAIDMVDTATDVASVASNMRTQKKIGEMLNKASKYKDKFDKYQKDVDSFNTETGRKFGQEQGIIETAVSWITDKAMGKPQRRRAINNYVSGSLVPEFSMQIDGIASDLKLAIGNLLHEEARDRCASMEQSLKDLKAESAQSKEARLNRMKQLKEYKQQLKNI